MSEDYNKASADWKEFLEFNPTEANACLEWMLRSYNNALKLNPTDTDIWHTRGVVLAQLGRQEEALSSLDKALVLDLTNADTWYNRGVALAQLGRQEEALRSYDNALKLTNLARISVTDMAW
jgi:Flp pilus assembly protein TadD